MNAWFNLKLWCGVVACVDLAAVDSMPSSTCQFWNTTSQEWSSMGVTVIGFAVVNGTSYLQCGSTHLTAFLGADLTIRPTFEVNVVDPVGDAGSLTVSTIIVQLFQWDSLHESACQWSMPTS